MTADSWAYCNSHCIGTPDASGNWTARMVSVPEPAAWAMMLFGLGAIGATMRVARRRGAANIVAG